VAAKAKSRQYPTAFKLKAIKRAEKGGGVLPVARKLGISRKLLHDWVKAWKAHGPEGLNRKRGPKPGPRKLKPLPLERDTIISVIAKRRHGGAVRNVAYCVLAFQFVIDSFEPVRR
jgi:transposase-like protein